MDKSLLLVRIACCSKRRHVDQRCRRFGHHLVTFCQTYFSEQRAVTLSCRSQRKRRWLNFTKDNTYFGKYQGILYMILLSAQVNGPLTVWCGSAKILKRVLILA